VSPARVPRSWKIIENPGKINFPGKSWKIDKNLKVIEKSKFWRVNKGTTPLNFVNVSKR